MDLKTYGDFESVVIQRNKIIDFHLYNYMKLKDISFDEFIKESYSICDSKTHNRTKYYYKDEEIIDIRSELIAGNLIFNLEVKYKKTKNKKGDIKWSFLKKI